LAAIRREGVQAVFRGEGGNVAVIGDRCVRVGDMLEGFRVKAITIDGVVVADIE
jgi:hypothetical protein